MRKGIKAAIISAVSVAAAGAILVGSLWFIGQKSDPVSVYGVDNFSIVGSDFGSDYYYGPVRADNLQTVILSDTQIVTEVLVQEGQTVKKGDALLRYDTTLSDIQLERQELAVKQAQLALETAQKELQQINAMKPYSPPATEPTTEPTTEKLEPVEELPYLYGGKGTQERPYRILWSAEQTYDEAYLLSILGEKTEGWFAFEIREENAVAGELLDRFGLHVTVFTETVEPEPTEPSEPTEPEPTESTDPEPTEESTVNEPTEQTESNPAASETTKRLYYSFFVPTDDPTEDDDHDGGDVWVDDSSGYTSAQIAQMRTQKQKEIRDCDLKYRMAQVELERMRAEADGGTVYAKLDGTIMSLVDEETARENDGGLLVLSGGGRYYIDIAVDEFTCQTLAVGTPVTVQTWWPQTATYDGEIEEVTTTPSDSNYYYSGTGNPNVTYYKVVVSIPGDAVIQEGNYVDVQMGSSGDSDTLWLQNMFLRYDGSRAYVYVCGADGTLEKRYLQTGSDLWGYYTEIKGGLSTDDQIAFPYGKTVKEGAQTVEGTLDDLYNY